VRFAAAPSGFASIILVMLTTISSSSTSSTVPAAGIAVVLTAFTGSIGTAPRNSAKIREKRRKEFFKVLLANAAAAIPHPPPLH
jgi:hypothetical protein